MGCDVHMHAEYYEDGSWHLLEPPERVLYHYPPSPPVMGSYWYFGRDYRLFAMLADVRNGYGVAGCDTGDRIEPIDAPRGLPEDVCGEIAQEHGGWGYDAHSASYFTLRELFGVPWDTNMITQRGVVSPVEFYEWRQNGRPSSWSGGVSGQSVKHITNEQMAKLIADDPAQLLLGSRFGMGTGTSYYTQVQWTQTWRQALTYEEGSEWFEMLDALAKHTKDDGSDVRIVFWFDN